MIKDFSLPFENSQLLFLAIVELGLDEGVQVQFIIPMFNQINNKVGKNGYWSSG